MAIQSNKALLQQYFNNMPPAQPQAIPIPPFIQAEEPDATALILYLDYIPSYLASTFSLVEENGRLTSALKHIRVVQEGGQIPHVGQYLVIYYQSEWHKEQVEGLKNQCLGINPHAQFVAIAIDA